MANHWELPAEAILYAVSLAGETRIYGVENVLAGLEKHEFPAWIARSQSALSQAQCGTLDFNGDFNMAEDFKNTILRCARCQNIAGFDIRRSDAQEIHLTCYCMGEESVCFIKRGQNYEIECMVEQSMASLVLEQMDLHENAPMPPAVVLESGFAKQLESEQLEQLGCAKETAQLIHGAAMGERAVCSARRLQNREPAGELALISGKEGVMEVTVDYTAGREDVLFTPRTASEAQRCVEALLMGGDWHD